MIETHPIRTTDSPALRVIHDPAVNWGELDYNVNVDEDRATKFLVHHGMPPERLQQTSLFLTRTYEDATGLVAVFGAYARETASIILYTDDLWKYRPGEINKTWLHEARHALDHDFLPTAEQQQATARRFALLDTCVNTLPLGLAAGSIYLASKSDHPKTFGVVGTIIGLASILPISALAEMGKYRNRMEEKRARSFATALSQDPRWQDIVTLQAR